MAVRVKGGRKAARWLKDTRRAQSRTVRELTVGVHADAPRYPAVRGRGAGAHPAAVAAYLEHRQDGPSAGFFTRGVLLGLDETKAALRKGINTKRLAVTPAVAARAGRVMQASIREETPVRTGHLRRNIAIKVR